MDADIPATAGAYSVVVTTVGSNRIYAAPIELTGVDQTAGATVTGTKAQPNGSQTNPITLAVTTPNDNDFIVNVCSPGGGSYTAYPSGAAGQLVFANATDGSSYNIFTDTLRTTTAGSYTTGWAESALPSRQAMVVAAFKEYVAPAPSGNLFWNSEF
jgi:hypothetical protein